MRTTVPLDLPILFFIAGLFVLAGNRRIRRSGAGLFGRYFRTSVAYAIWWGIVVAYFYFQYPDWMWSYFLDSSEFGLLWTYVVFVAGLALSAGAGAIVTQSLVQRGKLLKAWLVALSGLVAEIVVYVLTWDRYVHVGTFEQYYTGVAPSMTELGTFQLAANLSAVLLGLPVLVIIVRNVRQSWGTPDRPHPL